MRRFFAAFAYFLSLMLLSRMAIGATEKEGEGVKNLAAHFVVESSAKKPSPDEIADYLEQAWQTFHDVFGVNPAPVKVVISLTSGSGAPSSQSDQERPAGSPEHQMAWAIKE